MTPTHFHVGVSSYSRSVIEATAHSNDADVFEIPTWCPGVLLPTLCASHMSKPLVAQVRSLLSSDQLWCKWTLGIALVALGTCQTIDSIACLGKPTGQSYWAKTVVVCLKRYWEYSLKLWQLLSFGCAFKGSWICKITKSGDHARIHLVMHQTLCLRPNHRGLDQSASCEKPLAATSTF